MYIISIGRKDNGSHDPLPSRFPGRPTLFGNHKIGNKNMFKVMTYNADATRSIYKIDGQKKTCSYAELLTYMAQASGGNLALMNDAEKKPFIDNIIAENNKAKPNESQQAFQNIIEQLEDHLPIHQQCLNAEMVEGFKKFIAWTSDDRGNVMWLARTNSTGNTWTIVDDILTYITGNKLDNVFIQELLSREYFKTRAKGKGGPTLYQIISEVDGSWSAPITKARLYWAAWQNLLKLGDVNATDQDLAIKAIQWMNERETNIDPFPTVFSKTGWLFNMWKTSPLASIEMPEVMTNDPEIPAFSFVNLSLATKGSTPDFDGWLEMMPEYCRGPFCASLYASMTSDCTRLPQITYLHGEGNDAKSSLMESLNICFGDSMVGAIDGKSATDDFGAEALMGKRLLILGDAQSGNILNTNLVHAITGGDKVLINRKNEKKINYRFKSIVMIAANTPPQVNMNNRNEARRLFYVPLSDPSESTMRKFCEYDPTTGKILRRANGMPKYKSYDLTSKLVAEMPHIMDKCKVEFDKYCPAPHKTLLLPDECFNLMMDKCGSDEIDQIESFMSTTIIEDKRSSLDVLELNNAYLRFAHGESAVGAISKHNFEINKLKRYIKTQFGIEPVRMSGDNGRIRVYKGLKVKTQIEGFSTNVLDAQSDFDIFGGNDVI